jgi:hypothetical protein
MKQLFSIDIASTATSSLRAHEQLARCTREDCRHEARELRMPLGIYNVSVSRVCDKVIRLCDRLNQYFTRPDGASPTRTDDDLMQEVIDYVELALYAAAEHVDDLEAIASGFFANNALRDKSQHFRALQKQIKKNKKFVTATANAIKHQQARIRMFSLEYSHLGKAGCLHGYFIEGVKDGVIVPSATFHKDQQVFSITSLAWEIIVFLLECSNDLSSFLNHVARQAIGPVNVPFPLFAKSAVAAARLPLYTFGEEHPFARATVRIDATDDNWETLQSNLYGSITNRWINWGNPLFGKFISRYIADGVTNSFRFPTPKSVAFSHWS